MFLLKQKPSLFLLRGFLFFKKYAYLFFIALALFLSYKLVTLGAHYLKKVSVKPNDLLGFFGSTEESLAGQGGRTNFLILGLRGEGDDSPDLTDTLIFVSYNQEKKDLTQISIPRDLWVPSLQDRINTAYHYGEVATAGGGIKLAQASVAEVLGQPVNYTVVINFNLFRELIDLVGGVDINVSPGFTDTEFPLPGKENVMPISDRYETISFPEGINHLDSEQALKFVRSRHANGDEGTDFARARRQQQIIGALKDKMLKPDFLLSKANMDKLLEVTEQNLTTNISPSLYPVLGRLGLDQANKNIKNVYLSTLPDSEGVSILYNPPVSEYKGKWVLVPKDKNYKALKQFIENKLLLGENLN